MKIKGIMPTATIALLAIFAGFLAMLYVTGITNPTNLPLVNITNTVVNYSIGGNLTINGTFRLANQSASGNSYLCINSTGYIYRNASCG